MTLRIVAIIIFLIALLLVVIPLMLRVFGVDIFKSPPAEISMETLLRSPDGGIGWEETRLAGAGEAIFRGHVSSFKAHPTVRDTIFLGVRNSGFWKSTDSGLSWRRLTDTAGALSDTADIADIAIGVSNENVLYLAVNQSNRGRVLRSGDGGSSFREIFLSSIEGIGVFAVEVNPFNEDHILVGTGQGGLFESRNGGGTWHIIHWFPMEISSIFVNPWDRREMVIMLAGGMVEKTLDGGDNWLRISDQSVSGGLPPRQVTLNPFSMFSQGAKEASVFEIAPWNPAVLYGSRQGGIIRSLDGGLTWERLNLLILPSSLPITAVGIHPELSDFVVVAASNELHWSSDGGVNWRITRLKTTRPVRKIVFQAHKPDSMFLILD
jgi:hypothetical protein